MAAYQDLFGFDRFRQAQEQARQWERQQMQDQRLVDQDAYTRRKDEQVNALATLKAQDERNTQNALSYIQQSPEFAHLQEQTDAPGYSAVRQELLSQTAKRSPGFDPAKIDTFVGRREFKAEPPKYAERDKPVGKNQFQREYRDESTGGKWLPLGKEFSKTSGTQISIGGGKTLPAGQLESLADMEQVKRALNEAKTILDGKKVDTGPLSGRYQSAAAKIGGATPEFVQLKQKLSTAENIMLKLRSGAAVTQSEYERFLNEYPNVNDSPEVARAKAANAVNYATELLNLKIETYKEGGYKTPNNIGNGQEIAPGITILSIEDAQ